tara:strand:- start:226 stop:804 length:579 start_codon:yes stop_codon:yes gene_type:complete
MPITLNGDGTVTGVSVGGLPDGIVDTDMLAANAVSSAKLASGAGGLFKNWNYTTDNTHVTLQNAGDIYTQLNTAITPSSTDSRIIIIVNLGLVSSDGAADVGYDILRDSTALEQGQSGTVNATAGAFMNAGASDAVSSTVILVDHPNTTSAVTYKVASDANSGRDLIINRRGADTSLGVSSRMFLIEIGNKS